ncbi:MAG: hypothetical protein ACI39U_03285 [Candidatus Cryptobacteroides sp.]
MKKILTILAATALATAAFAQKTENKVPVAVFVPESVDNVPEASRVLLETRLNTIASRCGMGASELTQFYLTCYANVVEKDVVPGAPAKYINEVELTVAVVDALGKRIFDSCNLTLKGVGNSEQKAFNSAFKNLQVTDRRLAAFMSQTNGKIISYYEDNSDRIISEALLLAKSRKYDEAFFRLSLVPEVCGCYTGKVLPAALDIWQEYLDYTSQQNYMKAKAVWAAGLDKAAAEEVIGYISEIPADSKYYAEAIKLLDEIKARVGADIDYERALEQRDADRGYDLSKSSIDAWKSIGVAFGENQQPVTYRESYLR